MEKEKKNQKSVLYPAIATISLKNPGIHEFAL